jgi:hypothetical protein
MPQPAAAFFLSLYNLLCYNTDYVPGIWFLFYQTLLTNPMRWNVLVICYPLSICYLKCL